MQVIEGDDAQRKQEDQCQKQGLNPRVLVAAVKCAPKGLGVVLAVVHRRLSPNTSKEGPPLVASMTNLGLYVDNAVAKWLP